MTTGVYFRLAGAAQPLLLVPVFINGTGPHQFILDTGCGTTLLSTELGRSLGVEATGSKEAVTAGGKTKVDLGSVASIALGEARLTNLDVAMTDLSDLGRAVGAKIDGDLGYNFLKHFTATIDYRSNALRLSQNEPRDASVGVPFTLGSPTKPLLLVAVMVNGQGPFKFAVDTGTSTTALSPELGARLGLRLSEIPPISTGGGHTLKASVSQLNSLEVGVAEANNLSVLVADFLAMLSQHVGAQLDGVLGHNFLKNYELVIDYPNGRLELK